MKRPAILLLLLIGAVSAFADEQTDYTLAYRLYEAGDYETAKDEFHRFARNYADSENADDALYLAGEAARKLGKYDEAIQAYRALQNDYPQSGLRIQALLGHAYAWRESGRLEESVLAFEKVAQQASDEAVKALAVYLLGDAQYKIGNYERALEAYDRILAEYPTANEAGPAVYGKGWTLFFLKRYQEAHDAMLSFAQTYPNAPEAPEALYRAAEALFVDPEKLKDAQQNETAKSLYEQFIRRHQENADVRRLTADASLRVGQCLFRLNQPVEARRQLELVIQRYPEIDAAEDAQLWIGNVLFHQGSDDPKQYERAVIEYQRLLNAYPDSDLADEAQYSIGRCLLALDRFREAAESFKRVADNAESQFRNAAAFQLAECRRNLDEHNTALIWYRRVEPGTEYEDDALFGRGSSHFALREYEDAIKAYETVSKMQKSRWRKTAIYNLGRSLFSAGRFKDADAAFDRFLNDPAKNDPIAQNDQALYWQTRSRYELKQYAQTAASANRLLSGYPKSSHASEARFFWGEALYWQQNYSAAREQYRRLIQSAPKSAHAAQAEYNIGWTHFSEAQNEQDKEKQQAGYQEAVNAWRRFIDKTENNPALTAKAAFDIGVAQLNMKLHDEAIETFLSVSADYPNSDWADDAQYRAAWTRYIREDYDTALNGFTDFLKRHAGSALKPEAIFFRGNCYFKLKRYQEAIADYTAAAEQYPNAEFSSQNAKTQHIREEALYQIGESRYNLEEHSQAIESYRRLQELYPKSELADDAQFAVAAAQQLMGEAELSLTSYRELVEKYPKSPLAPDALYAIGIQRYDRQQYQEAIAEFQKVVSLYGASAAAPRAQYDIGQCYFQLKSFPQATAAFDKAAAMPNATAAVKASSLYFSAWALQDAQNPSRDLNETARRLQDLIKTYPKSPEAPRAYLLMADAYSQQLKPEEMIQAYRQLIAEYPKTEEAQAAQIDLGDQLLELTRNQEALDAVASITENQSDYKPTLVTEAQLIAGDALVGLNRYEDAARSFLIVAVVYPNQDPYLTLQALVKAGDAYERLSKIDLAVRWYDKAVQDYQRSSQKTAEWDPFLNHAQRRLEALRQQQGQDE